MGDAAQLQWGQRRPRTLRETRPESDLPALPHWGRRRRRGNRNRQVSGGISRVNEDYVEPLPEAAEQGASSRGFLSRKGPTVLAFVGIVCIIAVLYAYMYRLRVEVTEDLHEDGQNSPPDNAQSYFKQQRLAFHFQPEKNCMSAPMYYKGYDLETHAFEAEDKSMDVGIEHRYDWGKFYASKTFYDPTSARGILWGYVNESDNDADDFTKGWACAMAVPRTIWLDPMTKSNLLIWPVEEINTLRSSHSSHHNIELEPAETWKVKGGEGNQLDILVTFNRPNVSAVDMLPEAEFDCSQKRTAQRGVFGPFGVLVLADEKLSEHTGVFFYIHRTMDGGWGTKVCSDQSKSSLKRGLDKTVYGSYLTVMPKETELSLRILVDNSMVESFVQGGRFAITARVYPQIALGKYSNVYLFNNGTTSVTIKSIDVYKMGSVPIPHLSPEESDLQLLQ